MDDQSVINVQNREDYSGEPGNILKNGNKFVVSQNDRTFELRFGEDEAGDYADLFIVRGRFPERIDRGRCLGGEWLFDRRSDQCPFIAAAKSLWLTC